MKLKHLLFLVILLTLLFPASLAQAQSTQVTFELVALSTFVVETPQPGARWLHSIFRGETYRVGARTQDGKWLFLSSLNGWVLTDLGKVSGELTQLPAEGEKITATVSPKINPLLHKGVPTTLSERAKQIYQFGLSIGNNPRTFSKIGDCNSVSPFFLTSFDAGEYRLGQYVYLQETLSNFAGSFGREGYTAQIGFSTESIFDPLWSNPIACGSDNPLECEYRLQRPSVAFISLGTNGAWLSDEVYERGLRNTIRFLVARGVLPILSTKADALDEGRFNPIVKRLAQEYELPLWDFQLAVSGLINYGLGEDQYHLTWGPSYFEAPLYAAWQWRNLTALQTLDSVWRNAR